MSVFSSGCRGNALICLSISSSITFPSLPLSTSHRKFFFIILLPSASPFSLAISFNIRAMVWVSYVVPLFDIRTTAVSSRSTSFFFNAFSIAALSGVSNARTLSSLYASFISFTLLIEPPIPTTITFFLPANFSAIGSIHSSIT